MRANRAVLALLLVTALVLGGLVGSPPAGAAQVPPGGTTAATCFTDLVYEIFLQRRATEAELDEWVPALVGGTPRYVLVLALAGSDEWLGVTVTELYQQALDRDPDPEGLAHWVAKLRAGVLVNRIGAQIFGSPEFYARADSDAPTFVTDLYRSILERGAGETEIAYWVDQIEARGRGGVASQLYASYESRARRVGRIYKHLLARQPQEADVVYWAERLRR